MSATWVSGKPIVLTTVVLVQWESGEAGKSHATLTVHDPGGTAIGRTEVDYNPPPGSVLGFLHAPVRFVAQEYGRFVVEVSTSSGLPTVIPVNIVHSERDRA